MGRVLKGQVAIITGASRGIGKAVAIRLAQEGVRLCMVARSRENLAALAKILPASGDDYIAIGADVRDEEQVKNMVESTLSFFGQIDILVNSAGITIFKSLDETSQEDWDITMDTNLKGTFLCIKHVVPHMLSRRTGDIVNISSIAGRQGFENSSAYCASKFGVIGLSKALSLELRKQGLRVITICPGAVDTSLWDAVDHPPDRSKMLQPRDVANMIHDVLAFSDRGVIDEITVTPPLGVL